MLEYIDYDRISDTLIYFDNGISFEFSVQLSKPDMMKNRRFFESEYSYPSKYSGRDNDHSIKRVMSYNFALNVKDNFMAGIMLRNQDVEILSRLISENVLPWFMGNSRIFKVVDSKLTIIGNIDPVLFTQSIYKYIRFDPTVIDYNDGTFKEGVRMEISDPAIWTYVDIDKLFGLLNLLKNTDMYGAAIGLTNYAKMGPHGLSSNNIKKGLGGGRLAENNSVEEAFSDVKKSWNNNSVKKNKFLDSK